METVNPSNNVGVCTYGAGGKYNGQWKDDVRNGRGTLKLTTGLCEYSNGDKYEGQWQDDKRSGHGSKP